MECIHFDPVPGTFPGSILSIFLSDNCAGHIDSLLLLQAYRKNDDAADEGRREAAEDADRLAPREKFLG